MKSLCMLSRIGCLPASIANGPLSGNNMTRSKKKTWQDQALLHCYSHIYTSRYFKSKPVNWGLIYWSTALVDMVWANEFTIISRRHRTSASRVSIETSSRMASTRAAPNINKFFWLVGGTKANEQKFMSNKYSVIHWNKSSTSLQLY